LSIWFPYPLGPLLKFFIWTLKDCLSAFGQAVKKFGEVWGQGRSWNIFRFGGIDKGPGFFYLKRIFPGLGKGPIIYFEWGQKWC
jgi:hypothetical protein